ncbi:sushi domain-containing protein 2-like [Ptychodera flava]|uniref:sushi domain-containing protein 2-like n=1 Tax=Ptychodera flava TaxID=63121 RepID=UPI00396A5B4E
MDVLRHIIWVLILTILPLFSSTELAGLPNDQFHHIKSYIAGKESESKLYKQAYRRTDPRSSTQELIIGYRFRFQKANAWSVFASALGVSRDFVNVRSGREQLNDAQIDALFEADLPNYISETRDKANNFDAFPVTIKTALVDSLFTNYSTDYMWDLINSGENWVAISANFTHDPAYPDVQSRIQGDCELMMDYAKTLNQANSTYNACTDSLMFPFGTPVGDSVLHPNDDGNSGEIFVSIPFPFYDYNHDSCWVNTNGVISFVRYIKKFNPAPFPLDKDKYGRMVAPFWADADTRNGGGEVYYRQITDPDDVLLFHATEEIHRVFPTNFVATWAFVATWDNVAFFGASVDGKERRNTFQCILVTNGRHSFAIFNYGKITWTTGAATQGDLHTGLGGIPAMVGFNGGDGDTSHSVKGSRTGDIVNIHLWSNVNVTGRFTFRIDNTDIEDAGCNTGGSVVIHPLLGSMLGGDKVMIFGPCFNPSDTITCRFGDIEVDGLYESPLKASCITPTLYETGRLEFRMTVSGLQSGDYMGIFTVVSFEYYTPSIIRQEAHRWHETNFLTITWDPKILVEKEVAIHLFGYKEDGDNVILENVQRLGVTENDAGTFTFEKSVDTHQYKVGVIKIVEVEATDLTLTQALWSDFHNLRWDKTREASQLCKDWAFSAQEYNRNEFVEDLAPCPCTLQQARVDRGRYSADPHCNERFSHRSDNCHRTPNAVHCVRENYASVNGAGQKCCYDDGGNIINGQELENSGGTAHRRHHGGVHPYKSEGKVPYLSYFLSDIVPWENCCNLSSEHCGYFYERRPTDLCQNYEPPRPGCGVGDPHIMTLDGTEYTFNGHGEFYMLKTTNNTFTMQARMETLETGSTDATVFTAMVMQESHSDRVQVQVNQRRLLDCWIYASDDMNNTWQRLDFEETSFWDFAGFSVINDEISDRNSTQAIITISFHYSEISMQFTATEGLMLMSFMFFGPPSLKGNTEGLMGLWNDNPDDDLMTPDGSFVPVNSSLREIHYDFGMKWTVPETETMFFYGAGKSFDEINDDDYTPIFEIPDSVPENAVAVCGDNFQCIFDYHATGGDERIAGISKKAVAEYDIFVESTKKVMSCGDPGTPTNGSRTVSKYVEGGVAVFSCDVGFNLAGSTESICLEDGTWNVELPKCQHQTTPTAEVTDTIVFPVPVEGPQPWVWIVVGAAGGLVIALLGVIAILCWCMRSSKMKVKKGDRSKSYNHDKQNPAFNEQPEKCENGGNRCQEDGQYLAPVDVWFFARPSSEQEQHM